MPIKKAVKKISKTPRVSKALSKVKKAAVQKPVASKISFVASKLKVFKQPKFLIPLIVILVVAILYAVKGIFVVAMVNGEPITRVTVVRELEKQGGKQVLSSLVNQALIMQEARKKKVQVSQAELNTSAKQIEDSIKAQGQDLDTALAMQGMTRDDFMTQLKLRATVEKLLADKIKITPKEVSDYIQANKEMLPTNMAQDQLNKTVEEQLKQQKLSDASQSWLDELNKNAKVNYFVSY